MNLIISIFRETGLLFYESAAYIIFGLVAAGLLRVLLPPSAVARHLSGSSVLTAVKAAILGIPIPLCSCGVLPAAVSLKKQGANTGAVTSFLIATPESGVDSIAATYALMDPIMTVARPVAAFATAAAAGIAQNLLDPGRGEVTEPPDLSCPVDACCDGTSCDPEVHARHHTFVQKISAGLRDSFTDIWADMAGWYLAGLFLAGAIMALVPPDIFTRYLGGGIGSMLIMLAMGIPIYICATASTPVAAALVLKGVSPGAALVFLLAGPATNITSLTVLFGLLGKRATAIYLACIAVFSVAAGLLLDMVYLRLGLSAFAMAGKAHEFLPEAVLAGGAVLLLAFSVKPWYLSLKNRLARFRSVPGPEGPAEACKPGG
ncbi:MAG: SO_0444 family Cu/Zn efflux transporter [Thermodesulfobacteriota bacterium]